MAAPWLADALRAGGLPVVEEPGWQGRGTGGTFTPLGVLAHHTAGPAVGDLPSLRIVRDGRTGLPGPLSQLMLSRSGRFHVIAAGRANHAGIGAAGFVPANDGNRYLIGIEAESAGTRDDWTLEQRVNYPRGVAALLRWMRVGEGNVLGHKEWAPTRKIDPAFWDMNAFRRDVRNWLNGARAPEEDIVASLDDLRNVLREFDPARRGDVGYARDQVAAVLDFDPVLSAEELRELPAETRIARRAELGWGRDQTANALGFDPTVAPVVQTDEERAAARPLRQGDIPAIVAAVVAALRPAA